MSVLIFTFILILGSMAAGILGALTGLGGGVIIVPLLSIGLGIDMHYAIGASLISVIGTSSGSAAAYVKEGFSNMRIGMFLEIATTIGAIVGAFISIYLPGNAIAVVFGIVLCYSAVAGAFKRDNAGLPLIKGSLEDKLKLYGTFPQPDGSQQSYAARHALGGLSMMGIAGLMSGLLGIGSGSLKVLAMDNIMKLPFKVSTTTSNFMIGVTAAASSIIYFQKGYVIPEMAAPIVVGILIGAMIGARILVNAKVKQLKMLFAVVVGALSLYMMYKGITGQFSQKH